MNDSSSLSDVNWNLYSLQLCIFILFAFCFCLFHAHTVCFHWQIWHAVCMILPEGSFGLATVTYTRFLQMVQHCLDLRVQNMTSKMLMVLISLSCWLLFNYSAVFKVYNTNYSLDICLFYVLQFAVLIGIVDITCCCCYQLDIWCIVCVYNDCK